MSNFVNEGLTDADHALGAIGKIQLRYGQCVNLPTNYIAIATMRKGGASQLMIHNISRQFPLTLFITPAPPGKQIIHIPANDPTPVVLVYNWNGATVKIANISQNPATARVCLY